MDMHCSRFLAFLGIQTHFEMFKKLLSEVGQIVTHGVNLKQSFFCSNEMNESVL